MSMCRVFPCVVGRGCLLWPVHSLGKTLLAFALLHSIFQGQICLLLRESFPRQVDKESRGPQGERGLEFSGREKGQTFFLSPHSLGLYNNNVSCLRTVFGLNLLANSVILKCKLWEVFTTSRHSLEYVTSLLTLASGYSFCPLLMPEAFSISFVL